MGKVASRGALGAVTLVGWLSISCGQQYTGGSYGWSNPPGGNAANADAGRESGSGAKGNASMGSAAASAAIDGGAVTVGAAMWDAKTATDAIRKVKNLLVGLPPADTDVMAVMSKGPAALQQLILDWMTSASTLPLFQNKMIFFFRNAFQQIGFTPTVDFQNQLLQNGGFDFGPFGTSAVGDDSYAGLVQNLQDEFAMTAWQLVQEGHSFLETLTTQRYMMTTGLKMVYLQIEMPNDQPFSFGSFGGPSQQKLAWSIDYSGNPIPLANAIKNMVFSDEPPANAGNSFIFGNNSMFPTCHGSTTTPTGSFTGYAQLFQRIIGYTPRYPFAMMPTCWEHPSKPYLTTQDVSDWGWVTIQPKANGDAYIQPYDLPTLRNTTTLKLALPRIGFYTTPAFLALWNTNDSNQHRVSANQTLLAALGESFTSDSMIVPINETGLDSAHTTTTGECYGCHKSLDPMRSFWSNQLDFNDRNDWLINTFMGAVPNPKPSATGGVFAFADVNATGASITDLGSLLGKVTDGNGLNQFAVGMAQKLCFYANSTACDTSDPEFRRVVSAFAGGFNFPTLIKELFASPLVTGATDTKTFAKASVPVSISRRDHFCQALSNRLQIPDVCALAVTLPSPSQTNTATIAGTVVADAFSRGSPTPVTPQDPNLFFRAAVETLCQAIAPQVVDAGANSLWSSTNPTPAINDMVQRVMGYPPGDVHYTSAVSILQSHLQSTQAQSSASIGLRSTFVLACESPTSVAVGL